jgi:hypothetical protein
MLYHPSVVVKVSGLEASGSTGLPGLMEKVKEYQKTNGSRSL